MTNMTTEHPNLLFWYVSGDMDSSDRSQVESHLERCEECRIEVRALASMMRSLKFHARGEHIASAELISYEERSTLARADRRAAIEAHLQTCADCAEDLESLKRAHDIERRTPAVSPTAPAPAPTPAPTRPDRLSIRAWALYACVAAAILLATVLPLLWRPTAIDPMTVTPVVFAAPQRGPEARRVLPGSGPWSVRVILPLDSPLGGYLATVLHEDGTPVAGFEASAQARDESGVVLVLPQLPAPGRYLLLLRLESGESKSPEVYPFEVVPPDNGSRTS